MAKQYENDNENRTKVRKAIKDFWVKNCYAPDLRDIIQATGIPQTTVYFHLKSLRKTGEIVWNGGNSIRPVGMTIRIENQTGEVIGDQKETDS